MADEERWLDLWDSVETIMLALQVSIGKAQALLVEACASGEVRSRTSQFLAERNLQANEWDGADIDLDEGAVINGLVRMRYVKISADDLGYWLRQHSTSSTESTASAPASPTAAEPARTDAAATTPTEQPTEAHAPPATVLVRRTGLAGRPTSWDLIEPECSRRFAAGERHKETTAWARVLIEWLKTEHPTAAVPKEKTLTNNLAGLLRELRSASQTPTQPEP